MNIIISQQTIFIVLCSLTLTIICVPICHDTVPFSTKLAQSPLVVYGDITETSIPVSFNNYTKPFNISFLVKCTLKGIPPTNQNIIIHHTLPDNPICYRTFIYGYTYIYFLNQTNTDNYYKQIPFHELLFNEDTTIEILKRTCGIQARPFHEIIKENSNEIDNQCPIVSIGCS
ncbi:unnamed protein product [Adineta steineri]|uniref:Uncharacterized protein n=1 Tax=Adineta steineri TaxID=433720 RepID=A0A813P7A6_9BILA|nr:unnamed protein product [Adineta steineri]CAF0821316.1 unnamed protein product [Adineta steineri]CAF0861841.1 unnamed protein product [Adineta steineri]